MEKVKISKNMTIKLPPEVRKFAAAGDEFVLSLAGDSIRLKKIKTPDLLNQAATKKDNKTPTMKEISRIVHSIRKLSEDSN